MKNFVFILSVFFTSFFSTVVAQVDLDNVIVVAQQNQTEDRYNLELAVIDFLRSKSINTRSGISITKEGQGPPSLANDSLQNRMEEEGFPMFMLVSVRGYNKRYSISEQQNALNDELKAGNLFAYHREDISSVTFTISFYRNGVPVHAELIRVTKTKSPEKILSTLIKKMERQYKKVWKKN